MLAKTLRIGLAVFLLTSGLLAQTNIDLRSLSSGRGLVALGEGGLEPPYPSTTPLAGSLGASMAWADLNGDGIDDLIMGAPDLAGQPSSGVMDDAGHVYIVFGGPEATYPGEPGDLDLKAATCVDVLDLVGAPADRLGFSVASAGDVDGDGFGDLIIGAPDCGPNFRGAAYLLYGSADLPDVVPGLMNCRQSLGAWLGTRATQLNGEIHFGQAGFSVSGDVDVNADGLADVIIGAPLASTGARLQNGQVFVLYGAPGLKGSATVDLSAMSASEGVELHGADDLALLGSSVAGLGRFDPVLPGGGEHATLGDDVALGAPGISGPGGLFAGAVYVLRGVTSGDHGGSLDTNDFGPGMAAGPVWHGAGSGDQLGLAVARAGDLVSTGDGFEELLASAPLHDGLGRQNAGGLYLIAGRLGGVGPEGFDLAELGNAGPGQQVLRLVGPTSFVAEGGMIASPAGDLDDDGLLDLAVGLPGATVSDVVPVLSKAGIVDVVGGELLAAPLDATIDLATLGDSLLMRLRGETAGALAGSALALGDFDDDGFLDLAVGSPRSPSDPDPQDPTGLALSETGRGQVLFGPLMRIGDLDPVVSWFEGPEVNLTVFNLEDVAGVSVTLDGALAELTQVLPGDVGSITLLTPVPPTPGNTGDLVLTTPQTVLTLVDVFTFQELLIDTGPVPDAALPGVQLDFTGQAFDSELTVTIGENVVLGGVVAPILSVDTLLGTLAVSAPAGLPSAVALDVRIEGANGEVLLPRALTYEPFVVINLSPTTGPQDAGVFYASPGGVGYEGQPAVPVSFEMITSDGVFPPDTLVEFGTDALGYNEALITSQVGDLVTVDLPTFYVGPQTAVVNLRVTAGGNVVVLDDVFTYDPSDFTLHEGTASVGLGPEQLTLLMAGGFAPGEQLLYLFEDYAKNGKTQALFLVLGIALIDPPQPVKGVKLGVTPDVIVTFPGAFLPADGTFPFSFSFEPEPGQEGLSLYFQIFTQEVDGPTSVIAASEVMEMTARID
ncbi:MAG: hypothetical protein DRQ55_05390 [Planctomycetota bacterium]|nr:MAG: hypothetical protein DRQ55_05390 [Planctomycetota bacterium]